MPQFTTNPLGHTVATNSDGKTTITDTNGDTFNLAGHEAAQFNALITYQLDQPLEIPTLIDAEEGAEYTRGYSDTLRLTLAHIGIAGHDRALKRATEGFDAFCSYINRGGALEGYEWGEWRAIAWLMKLPEVKAITGEV